MISAENSGGGEKRIPAEAVNRVIVASNRIRRTG